MKELVVFLAQSIVDAPDAVQVNEISHQDGTITYELSVAKSDMGKIIGKNGRVIQSVRSVLIAAAKKANKTGQIDLGGVEGGWNKRNVYWLDALWVPMGFVAKSAFFPIPISQNVVLLLKQDCFCPMRVLLNRFRLL